jgi:DNA-binding transcriptional MerR regulator
MQGLSSSVHQLPKIPSKLYFTIGEASKLCEVKPHVLRYWEQEFNQLRPVKRKGNRRYYRKSDIETVRNIKRLLHDQGYTIGGARQVLAIHGTPPNISSDTSHAMPQIIDSMVAELESVLNLLD